MKISAQEEYGLRLLIRIASCRDEEGLNIPQLSDAEGLSPTYIAKLTRMLRMAGFIKSTPGNKGGYLLALPANAININGVLKAMGGSLYDSSFCGTHAGSMKFCTNSIDCSARSLWQLIQLTVDRVLDKISLLDLVGNAQYDNSFSGFENALKKILNEEKGTVTKIV